MIDIKTKIKEVLSNVLELDESKITDSFSQNEFEGWDSIKHLNLILVLEEVFSLQIDDDDIQNLISLNKIQDYIESHLK